MTTDADPSWLPRPADPNGGARRRPVTRRGVALAVGLCLTTAPVLAACSSGSGHPSAASSTAVATTCTQVSATLSDGPDPDADPVGYAEAQIKPLAAIATSDATLRTAITALAQAYSSVYRSDNSATAKQALAAAAKKVNAICPGATS